MTSIEPPSKAEGRRADTSPPVPFSCLADILRHHATQTPDASALLGPGRAPLTYARLHQQIGEVGHNLRSAGIRRGDRVALVLPNGPDMAVAILAVAANATCAPMNPVYGADELDRYFADLRPRALITSPSIESPAARVARARGITVLELSTIPDAAAGLFMLTGPQGAAAPAEPVGPSDVAFLLFTSGTTARPKRVPMTHANICAGAYAYVAGLALTNADRALNVLPLFHGHGLVATVLTSLAAGASVVCTPGCDVNHFFGWLRSFQPTWYSAVPTMHQALLARARQDRERVGDHKLRFIRSASAPLPPTVFAELEETFGAPVLELYGMTETGSSAIACNPLPPRQRKVGSVGVPVGLEVAVLDDRGTPQTGGTIGEIVVRGPSVMSGYDADPAATKAAFVDDWFRTGDHGYFDPDGYLVLVGRKQEIINRGGEKFAPREVDEVLLEHPAVAEAATFAVPHPTLGEDVASAVILRPHAKVTATDIRQFVVGRLADFKIPREVLIVGDLPKGPTGKVQRIGLAEKLGLTEPGASQFFEAPETHFERLVAEIWADILQVERVGRHDNFFALGGDSLLATDFLTCIHERLNIDLDVSCLFDAPTVAEMGQHLGARNKAGHVAHSAVAIVPMPRCAEVPASAAQDRLFRIQRALPDIPCFNILYALRVTPPFIVTLLEQSFNEIVRRHEILRTTFAQIDARTVQVIAPHAVVPLEFHDLSALPPPAKEAAGHRLLQEESVHPFDLEKGPLIRACIVRMADDEHLLLLGMHQAIFDGWSIGVLIEELVCIYDAFAIGMASPLAPMPLQHADFADWQSRWKSNPDIVQQLAYWQQQLRGPLRPITFAPRGGRHRTIDDLHTARSNVALPAPLVDAVRDFAHQEGATLFMALQAAMMTVLRFYFGHDDVRVATDVANRNRPGTERLIGRLANTVVLRTDLSGDPTPREVMHRVRATTLAAFRNQELPFDEMTKSLGHNGRATRDLTGVMLSLQNATLRPATKSAHLGLEEAGPEILTPPVTMTAYDMILTLRESVRGLVGTCVYKPAVIQPHVIERLMRDFRFSLECMTTNPGLPISSMAAVVERRDSWSEAMQ